MQYVKYLEDALKSFERDLRADVLNMNEFNNDLINLSKKRDKLKEEVVILEAQSKDILDGLNAKREEVKNEAERLTDEANGRLENAHMIFEEARKARQESDNIMKTLKVEKDRIEILRVDWEGRVEKLKQAMVV